MDLRILAELSMRNPAWGAGRLAETLWGYDLLFSRATVGRMLAPIKRRCPICWGTNGHHWEIGHLIQMDILT